MYVCGLVPCNRRDSSAKLVGAVEAAREADVHAILFVGGLEASMEEE